jgi:hypothetical protein
VRPPQDSPRLRPPLPPLPPSPLPHPITPFSTSLLIGACTPRRVACAFLWTCPTAPASTRRPCPPSRPSQRTSTPPLRVRRRGSLRAPASRHYPAGRRCLHCSPFSASGLPPRPHHATIWRATHVIKPSPLTPTSTIIPLPPSNIIRPRRRSHLPHRSGQVRGRLRRFPRKDGERNPRGARSAAGRRCAPQAGIAAALGSRDVLGIHEKNKRPEDLALGGCVHNLCSRPVSQAANGPPLSCELFSAEPC